MTAEWSGPLKIRPARVDDAKEIARIYNQGVQDRAATFENAYVTPEERYLWLAARPDRYPVLVAEVKHTLMGWAALNPYSPRRCFDGVAELSIFIERSLRGHGVAQELIKAMQDAAREKGFYKLVGRIIADNGPARKLCELAGWREVGVFQKHGRLGSEWHDLVLVEFLIPENLK
ncbi:MAG TPA: arsinothricin resistance N-acetyltransferase ArsN1 family A [Terriglobia bacterium]|jgi:L-amino acid N-acyltransferase YncA|nr:arsinothricin resistance N-acetyltransferase ArsN1 family A [Terriglobia bacterium]